MAAIEQNAGKVMTINSIPHICVKLRNVWHWRPFHGISARTFKIHKNSIVNHLTNPPSGNEQDWSIRISGAVASADIINGDWIPIPTLRRDGEFQIYRKKDDEEKWFYCTKDSHGKFAWWVGIKSKAIERKPWGFFKQLGASAYSMKPWSVEAWRAWRAGGSATEQGRWMESSVVILPISPETKYEEKVAELIRLNKIVVQNAYKECACRIDKWKTIGNILFNQLSAAGAFNIYKKIRISKII